MPAYSFKALDNNGKMLKGIIDGDSERQVRNQLRARLLKPIEVSEAGLQHGGGLSGSLFAPRIRQSDLALLTRQLATLALSNVPLDEALAATAAQSRKTAVKSLVLQIRNHVVAGHSLGSSLREFPRAFDAMYCAMVRAGESAGFLGEVLEQLADYIENRQYVRQKLQAAMIYPVVLLGVAVTVISLLMIFVMPQLISLFAHTDAQLPGLTLALVGMSGFLAGYWWLLVLLLASIVMGWRRLLRDSGFRWAWHGLVLKLPWAGDFIRAVDTERFASTLSMLVSSGVPLLEGLRIAGEVMANDHMKAGSRAAADAVQEGESLYKALDRVGIFPPVMVQMAASGESSGNLEAMLARSARNQRRELEAGLATVLGVMEPLIIVVMASVVGAIVMAVLLPIVQMNTLVG